MNPLPSPDQWEVLERRKAMLIPSAVGFFFLLGLILLFVSGYPLIGDLALIAGLVIALHALWVVTRGNPSRRALLIPVFGALILAVVSAGIYAVPRSFFLSKFGESTGGFLAEFMPIVGILLACLLFLSNIFMLVSRCTRTEGELSTMKEQLGGHRDRGKVMEAAYRSIINSCPVPTISVDMSQYVTGANAAWSKFLGYTISEALGRPIGFFLEEPNIPGSSRLFGTDGSPARLDTQVRAKDGALYPVRLTVVPIDMNGESHGFHCFFEDATHLFALERQILLLQRAQALRYLADHAAKTITAATRGVRTMVRWVQGERITAEEANRATTSIKTALRQSGMLADDLRLFYRSLLEETDTANLNVVVKRVTDFMRRLDVPGITVEESCSSEDLPASVQTAEIEQVLINLCINSLEAMPQGGVLRIATERLRTRDHFQPAMVAITITDTGKGVDSRIARGEYNIFQMPEFKPGQVGLGLLVSHRVIRRHGGKLSLNVLSPHGTRAEILLPLQEESKVGKVPVPEPRPRRMASTV
ncbi:MAG TPA: PAS domain S-box protein [bacterium]|nr:PAS domain S-box protein [bacterium]HQL62681.1 PAS domain S-box protein [bacterium]